MPMRRRLLAAMLALATLAGAQDRVIRFGLTGDYPPFAEYGADGDLRGADVMIARQVAAELGARAEFVRTTWPALSADFEARRFDIAIGGLTETPDRALIGTFSIPLMEDGKRPLALCRDRAKYASLAQIDRPGVRVQINRGPLIGSLARQWFHRAVVTVNPDDAGLIPALLNKRTDVWITDGVVVEHMARRYRGKLCATTATPFTHQTKAWLIRHDPRLVSDINLALGRALRSGAWQADLEAVP